MINTREYEELLGNIVEHYSRNSLKAKKIEPPQSSPAECLNNKTSYFGYAILNYKNQPITLQFLYPTERGSFISNGNEMSPSFQAVNIIKEKESAKKPPVNSKLSQFLIYPAALLFLKKRLETIFIRKPSQKTSDFEADYLEGLLNQTTFRKLSAYDDINLLAETASRRKIALEGGENMPATARFLDDTHRRKLCPLETPESTEIGLRLFVARDADLKIEKELPDENEIGLIISESTTDDILGYSSWIVPFLQHNDGARAMMGGKNFKQALPLLEPEIPLIKTGIEKELADVSGRLIRASAEGVVEEVTTKKIVVKNGETKMEYSILDEYPSNSETPLGHIPCVREGDPVKEGDLIANWVGTIDGEVALGRNVLVGYLPFRGYNIEDGIVISRSLAEKFSSRHIYEFRLELDGKKEVLESCINENETVLYGDVLASKIDYSIKSRNRKMANADRTTKIEFNKRCSGKVVKVKKTDSEVIIQIEALRTLEVGDKLTGRHGNKGVVTLILENDEMPYFRFEGQEHHLEVLLSPMGVVSRMNLGQILETHYSWLVKKEKIDPLVGKPFREDLDFNFLEKQLNEIGLENGKAELFLDKVSVGKTVVGWQYLAKLNHLAGDKFHVRTSGKKYSSVTNQPVKGKRLGGGQRIGEMEVWSLLGHGAFELLHEFLTVKSDDVAARESFAAKFNSELKLPADFSAKFPQTLLALQLYLRGLGFELQFLKAGEDEEAETIGETERIRLQLADENSIKNWASGKLSVEFIRECLIESNESHFQFLRSKFSPKFQDQLSDIYIARRANPLEQILIETKTFLSLEPVEREIDKLIGNELKAVLNRSWMINDQGNLFDKTLAQRFKKIGKVEISGDLEKLLTKHSEMLGAIEDLKKQEAERLNKNGKKSEKAAVKSTARVEKILAKHLTEAEQTDLNRLLLEEVFLRKGQVVGEVSNLEDSEIFGETRAEQRSWMGYIELAEPLPHPLIVSDEITHLKTKKSSKNDDPEVELPQDPATEEKEKRKIYADWEKRMRIWRDKNPSKILTVLPVIPIALRPSFSDEFQHVLTKLYRDVIIANRMLARSSGADRPRRIFTLYKAVERLFRGGKDDTPSLVKILEGKFGLLRRHLLGKRQDFSGRAVIVPDPTLKLDECGLPFEMLLKWLKPLVNKHLVEQRKMSAEEARETIKWALRENPEAIEKVSESLERIIEDEDQNLLVLINRQPSLHRYSVLAFKPKIRTDYAIGLPPMLCNGFNADFDGDTVAVHFPITQKSQEEARKLLPTNHLFSIANGNLMLSLGQDYALGRFMLNKDITNEKSLNGISSSTLKKLPTPDEKIETLKDFQDKTFNASTYGGASFSLFDIKKITLTAEEKAQLLEQVDKEYADSANRSVESAERLNQCIEDAVWRKLAENPDNPFARYFLSKARGNKAQLRQIAGSVGFVFDGEGNPLGPIKNSFFHGLSPDEYWQLSHSTRRTMIDKKLSVGEAGSLTRDLVEGAYEQTIIKEDCETKSGITVTVANCNLRGRISISGNEQKIIGEEEKLHFPVVIRSPLTCEAEDGICQKCYGINPATPVAPEVEPTNANYPELGAMVGVIAGQSIGERGTQLSMRTFHSGGKSMSLKDVKGIFCYGKINTGDEDADLSIESRWFNRVVRDLIVNRDAYDNAILPIHFEVILRAMKTGDNLNGCQKLATDWKSRNFLPAASYRELRRILREVFEAGSNTDNLNSPKSQIILGVKKRDESIK